LVEGAIVGVPQTPFCPHESGNGVGLLDFGGGLVECSESILHRFAAVAIVEDVTAEVMTSSPSNFSSENEAFVSIGVVLHLFHQEVPRDVGLPGIIGTAVEAMVVEDMNWNALLGQKMEKPGIQREFAEEVKFGNILDRDNTPSGANGRSSRSVSCGRGIDRRWRCSAFQSCSADVWLRCA
jgi:hypothetical protein